MWHSRTHPRSGELSESAIPLSLDTSRPLLIVGNGPSAANPRYDLLPDDPIVFRMNWFFLEEHHFYGRRVDAFLFSLPNVQLEAHLQQVVQEGWYDVGAILSPMLVPTGRDGEPHASSLWQAAVPQGDHWAVIAENPHLARFMMSRPLPTQGMQALAAALQLGFRDITLVGIDMYSSAEQRYGHVVPDVVQKALEDKDITPGYETNHSLDRDLEFLDTCLAQFPDADIRQIGPSPHLAARLARPEPREHPATFAGVPGPDLATRSKPTFDAKIDSTGLLEVRESSPLPHTMIDGRRCGYVTMVSGPTFHHGTRALARSLAAVSDVPLLALCTPTANAAALRASGIATLTVPEIVNPHQLSDATRRFGSTYTKLQAFRMTHLDRLVYLDSDMVILKNVDELFSGNGFAAVYDHGSEYHYERFNSGLFAVDPSQELFDRLVARIGKVASYDQGDQGFLNEMFPDWVRLPHEFSVNKRWSTQHPLAFNLSEARVIHFVGVKPWQPDTASEFDELYDLWYAQLSQRETADLARSLRTDAGLAIKAVDGRRSGRRTQLRRALNRRSIRTDRWEQGSLLRRAQARIGDGAYADALTLLQTEWPGDDRATAGLLQERAKALVLSGQLDAGYAALAEAAHRYPLNPAIRDLQRMLTPVMRARRASHGLVPQSAVGLAARWYARTR